MTRAVCSHFQHDFFLFLLEVLVSMLVHISITTCVAVFSNGQTDYVSRMCTKNVEGVFFFSYSDISIMISTILGHEILSQSVRANAICSFETKNRAKNPFRNYTVEMNE